MLPLLQPTRSAMLLTAAAIGSTTLLLRWCRTIAASAGVIAVGVREPQCDDDPACGKRGGSRRHCQADSGSLNGDMSDQPEHAHPSAAAQPLMLRASAADPQETRHTWPDHHNHGRNHHNEP